MTPIPHFWEVDGVPVSLEGTPDGGAACRAWDVPGGRPFKFSLAASEGRPLKEADFERLKKASQAAPSQPGRELSGNSREERLAWARAASEKIGQALVDNLNRNVSQGHREPEAPTVTSTSTSEPAPAGSDREAGLAQAPATMDKMGQSLADNSNRNVLNDHPTEGSTKSHLNPYPGPNGTSVPKGLRQRATDIPEGKAWRGWLWIVLFGLFGLFLFAALWAAWIPKHGPN